MDAEKKRELEERLRAARAATAEAQAELDADVEETELMRKLQIEERRAKERPEIAQHVRELGTDKCRVIETDFGDIVVKRPHPAMYQRFRDTEGAKSEDTEKLVRSCVVYPSLADFDRIIEEQPGLLNPLLIIVAKLAGARLEEVSGKS